jgi:hypothetical protein
MNSSRNRRGSNDFIRRLIRIDQLDFEFALWFIPPPNTNSGKCSISASTQPEYTGTYTIRNKPRIDGLGAMHPLTIQG